MKILVISDSHGNIEAIKHLVGFAKSEKMGAIFHCGDFSTPQDVVEVLKGGLPLYAVLGNADEARYVDIWNALEPAVVRGEIIDFELGGKRIGLGHQPEKVKGFIDSGKFDAVFHGHLHKSAGVKRIDTTLVVNPGALGSTAEPSFAIYDTDTNYATLIDLPMG